MPETKRIARARAESTPSRAARVAPIPFVQHLRAVAALMVVWHHAMTQVAGLEDFLPYRFGTLGVDLFFLISGFIMVVTTHGRSVSPVEFIAKRIARVVPLYWLLTLLMVATAAVLPGLFKTLVVTPAGLVQSLLFIPHYSQAFPGFVYPLLVPGWSLNYEMAFYAVFAATLVLPGALRLLALGGVIGFAVLAGVLGDPGDSALWFTYTHPILLEFLGGAVLGRLHIAGRVSMPRLKLRLLSAIGDSSYSLYLTHIFTLGAARTIWNRLHPQPIERWTDAWVFLACAIPSCVGVGWLCYRTVEAPIAAWFGRRSAMRPVLA